MKKSEELILKLAAMYTQWLEDPILKETVYEIRQAAFKEGMEKGIDIMYNSLGKNLKAQASEIAQEAL